MQRFLAVLAVAALAAVVYTTAAPGVTQAGPTAQQFAALKKQVAVLQKKTKKNEAVFAKAINADTVAIVANYEADACIVAITADEFQNTWNWIQPYPIISVDDKQACAHLSIPRVPPGDGKTTPPAYPYFPDLINLLVG
jgi:hypothetical protein